MGGGNFNKYSNETALRHCATSRKVVGSIPDGVIGIFIDIILSATLWHWG